MQRHTIAPDPAETGPRPRFQLGRWSWTELVIVLSLVALIAALCYPAIAAARRQAASTTCLDNLHKIDLATKMYLQDNDGGYPFSASAERQPRWYKALALDLPTGSRVWGGHRAALEQMPALHCPADSQGPAPVSYAVNAMLAGAEGEPFVRPERQANLLKPEEIVWAGEANKFWTRGRHFYQTAPDWVRPESDLGLPRTDDRSVSFYHRWLTGRDWTDLQADPLDCPDGIFRCKYPAFRHERTGERTGLGTFLFADGHVRAQRWGSLRVRNFFPRLTARQTRLYDSP